MSKKLAVIGTAGRQDDAVRINRVLYDAAYEDVVSSASRWSAAHGVSGGAAFADHLVVRAFLEGAISELTLYLPAHFKNGQFVSNPKIRFNPGQTCNTYHRQFSTSCELDSLAEIAKAIELGAAVHVFEGFHRRNSEVAADCQWMIAYTFGSGDPTDFLPSDEGFRDAREAGLKDGGTAHTWGECWKAEMKRHVNLNRLIEAG